VRPNRASGLQAYHLVLVRVIEAAQEQLGPRDYEALLALHRRWLESQGPAK
jgi:hypothetical protein